MVGVWVSAISRIGTCRSAREPCTKILREPGIGRVTDSESCPVCCSRSVAGLGMAFIGIVLLNPRTWMCGLLRGIRIMRREGIASRTKRRRGSGRMAGPRGATRQHGAACEASLRRSQPDQVRRVCLNHRPGRRYPRFGAN